MKKSVLLIGILAVVLFSCKKEEFPEEKTERPFFFLEGTLNGNELDVRAGEQSYYMETRYDVDEQGIYSFIGEMTDLSASNGEGTFRFILRDTKIAPNGEVLIDSAVFPGPRDFRTPLQDQNQYDVQFNSLVEDPNGTFTWFFGDGTSSNEVNPLHRYADSDIEKYDVRLEASFDGGSCLSAIQSNVFMPHAACSLDIRFIRQNELSDIRYESVPYGSGPFRYNWNFRTTFARAISSEVDYCYKTSPSDGIEEACLTVIDAANCEATVCRNVAIDTIVQCITNFDYSIETITTRDSTDFLTIAIEYIDADGKQYTSRHLDQPVSSYFEIGEAQDYTDNLQGEKTKSLTIRTDCWLYAADGSSIRLGNVEGKIAVAYP